jgi:DNA-directed RNA polymerase specialized sigma24 family protein
MPSDLQQLQRYASTGDAHAFRELVQAHRAMVHATALRVLRDAAAAQDVAQETFLELARKAGGITQFVAAWLHRVAWNPASYPLTLMNRHRQFFDEDRASHNLVSLVKGRNASRPTADGKLATARF